MRIVSYSAGGSELRTGLVFEGGGGSLDVLDIETASEGSLPPDMIGLLRGGMESTAALKSLSSAGEHSLLPITSVSLGPPIPRPGKVLAAAMNYQAHIVDDIGKEPFDRERTVPKLFLKPATAVIGPGTPLRLPRVSQAVDWEAELACVIGRAGRDIPVVEATSYVAGYTIINDISARSVDWPIAERESTHWDDFFDWLAGKWFDGFAPTGPWIVTADEIPDPQKLDIKLAVDGVTRQSGNSAEMLFSVAELVSFASTITTLEPGDLIATGTPSGVGDATGTFLRSGNIMEASVEGIGVLVTPVA